MNDMERLAVAQAVYKAVAEQVSTRNPGGVRGRMDQRVLDMYEATGAKSFDVRVNGEKVGTYSVSVPKSKDPRPRTEVVVNDASQVVAWARDNPDDTDAFVESHAAEFAEWQLDRSGTVVDGTDVWNVAPDRSETVPRTVLKVDAPKVAEALRGLPPDTIIRLLEDGS